MSEYLIVSDLDGTLLGDDDGLAAFQDWFASQQGLTIAYSSGRSFDSAADAVRQHGLPAPVAIISHVGVEMAAYPSGEPLAGWGIVDPLTWSAPMVRAALAREAGLEPQPDEFQTAFKVSYYFRNATEADLLAISDRLMSYQLACDVVYSSNRDLDVLPRGMNKGTAAGFLAERLGYPQDQVIVCGDSGNDAAMFAAGYRGVIVGNAQSELKALAGERAYLATATHATGVREGIEHWQARLSLL